MLDPETHRLWLSMSSSGTPPPPREVAEMQFGLQSPWHWVDHFYPILASVDPGAEHKNFFCREASRGHGKSVLTHLLTLYMAEYILPHLANISDANRRIILVGRDERHVLGNIMKGVHEAICTYAPWLKLRNWREIYESEGPAGIKNSMPKNFNKSEFNLTNGVTIQGRSIRQGLRGEHCYLIIIDDLIDEKTWTESHSFLDLINGAFRPAVEFGGTLLVVGTPQADGDLYDLMAADERWDYVQLPSESPDYRAKNEVAIKRGLLPASSIKSDLDWTCLWPWRMNHAQLMSERGNTPQSILKYQREYLLQRISDDDSFVRQSDAIAARDPSLYYSRAALPDEGPYFGGCDPSSLSRDDAAVCIGFVDANGNRVPRHFRIIRAKGAAARTESATPELEVIHALNESSLAFGNPLIKLEKNGYQGVIKPFAQRINPTIALSKIHLGVNKHTEAGWLAVRTLFRNGQIRLPYGPTPTEKAQIEAGILDPNQIEARKITDELVQQLMNLRVVDGKIINANPAIHDDLVSALFLFVKAAEPAQTGSEATSHDLPSRAPVAPAARQRARNPELDGPQPSSATQNRVANAQRLANMRRSRFR